MASFLSKKCRIRQCCLLMTINKFRSAGNGWGILIKEVKKTIENIGKDKTR